MAALPPNKNNNNKNNNNNNGNNNIRQQATNGLSASMFNDDIDAATYSAVGKNTRGAPKGYAPVALASQPHSMQFQDSFDNMPGGKAVNIMHVWGPKQIHHNRSIPKDSGNMGSKGGSYTLEAVAEPASQVPASKGGNGMKFIPSRVGGGGEKEKLVSQEHKSLLAQNIDIQVKEQVVAPKQQAAQQKAQQQQLVQQQGDQGSDEKGLELENYKEPIDHFANNSDLTPLIFNADYCALDCPGSSLDCDSLKKEVVLQLNILVSEGYVDWDYESRYTIQGRIYKMNEDAGYRITIYLLEDDDTEYQCMLEVRRNGGDSFLFQEFKSKFLGLMSDSNESIEYQKGPQFDYLHGFLGDDFCELPPLDDNDILSETDDLLTPLSSMSNMTVSATTNDSTFNKFDARQCVAEAIDTKQYRELYRECVGFLRNACDDNNKLEKIMAEENIVYKLLTPIHGNRQIYDTLVIKSLLEVIHKIVSKNAKLATADDRQAIKDINQQWNKLIPHPISDTIEGFFPSQQIQWISQKCIQQFSN